MKGLCAGESCTAALRLSDDRALTAFLGLFFLIGERMPSSPGNRLTVAGLSGIVLTSRDQRRGASGFDAEGPLWRTLKPRRTTMMRWTRTALMPKCLKTPSSPFNGQEG
jgi:hypothetical protein